MCGIIKSCNLFKNRRNEILVILVIVLIITISIANKQLATEEYSEYLSEYSEYLSDSEYKQKVELVVNYQNEIEKLSIWFAENKDVLEAELIQGRDSYFEAFYNDNEVYSRIMQSLPQDLQLVYDKMRNEDRIVLSSALKKIYENGEFDGDWEIKDPIIYSSEKVSIVYFYDTSQNYEKYKNYYNPNGIEDYNYFAFQDALGNGYILNKFTKINDNLYMCNPIFTGT